MCAILDADVRDHVFGRSCTEAGLRFHRWISGPKGHLVVGGKLLDELLQDSQAFKEWAEGAQLSGNMRVIPRKYVHSHSKKLLDDNRCVSNDHHIMALAQLSGSRLLYSHDKKLHQDFKNKDLIDSPRGKIYTSSKHKQLLTRVHRCRLRRSRQGD